MKKSSRSINWKIMLFQLAIFITMFVFFSQISPLVPFDADDWLFNGTMRGPYPLWGAFNPTRVLPEILNPLAGSISAFLVYPFTKDYIFSITLVDSILVALFISLMMYAFFNLLRKRLNYSVNISLATEILFFLSFFLIFKHINHQSYTGFLTTDTTCIFFYLIPGLINAIMLMILAQESNFSLAFMDFSTSKKGLIVAGLYFALFSNSQFNIILATFSFTMLVREGLIGKNKVFSLNFIKSVWLHLIILIMWLITVVFDLFGGRSTSINKNAKLSLQSRISATFSFFKSLVQATNKAILFGILLVIVIVFLVLIIKQKSLRGEETLVLLKGSLFSLVLTWIYLMIAYSKSLPNYAGRVDAMWPVLFFLLFIFSVALAYIINSFYAAKVIAPVTIILGAMIAFNFSCLPVPSITMNTTPMAAKRIDNYIINKVVAADRAGKSRVTVKVPLGNTADNNWPQSYYMQGALSQSLYTHRVTEHRIAVKFVPDRKINRLLNPAVKEQPFSPLEK